jgi:Na+/H+-dicarboxylate symporter
MDPDETQALLVLASAVGGVVLGSLLLIFVILPLLRKYFP